MHFDRYLTFFLSAVHGQQSNDNVEEVLAVPLPSLTEEEGSVPVESPTLQYPSGEYPSHNVSTSTFGILWNEILIIFWCAGVETDEGMVVTPLPQGEEPVPTTIVMGLDGHEEPVPRSLGSTPGISNLVASHKTSMMKCRNLFRSVGSEVKHSKQQIAALEQERTVAVHLAEENQALLQEVFKQKDIEIQERVRLENVNDSLKDENAKLKSSIEKLTDDRDELKRTFDSVRLEKQEFERVIAELRRDLERSE